MLPLDQSVWSRARGDFVKAAHTVRFWAAEVTTLPVAGALSAWLAPDSWSSDATTAFAAGVSVASAATFAWVIYLGALAAAPYRQRNELRRATQAARAPERRPVLRFGEPRAYQSETFTMTWTYVMMQGAPQQEARVPLPVQLWRVELADTEPETIARRVRVRLESDPPLPVFPVSVHEKHDNNPPYRQERDVRYGEPIEFDIIAKGIDNDSLYIVRSDMGEGYLHQLSDSEREAIGDRLWGNGWTLILRAVADPPAQGHIMSYRAVVDGDGKLSLEEDPAYAEIALHT